jgi:chorismate mutase-like protein
VYIFAMTVENIRQKIDSLDNQLHDLLMERAELVLKIGEEKRRNNVQVIQPDREILMIRRLLERHKGPLPREAVVRIWRELVGAVSLLQTGIKVAVTAPGDHTDILLWDMAKDYFSSVLPMQKAAKPLNVLAMVREGEATFGVLPWPGGEDANPWWRYVMDESGDKPLRIVARLPLGDRTKEPVRPGHQALVVARLKFEPSGEDRSFLALELDHNISRARLVEQVKAVGLPPVSLHSIRGRDPNRTLHLLEVDKYVAADDKTPAQLLEAVGCPGGRAVMLGGYPVPPVYDDRVGKGAEL